MPPTLTYEVLLAPHLATREPVQVGPWLIGPPEAHQWPSPDVRAATDRLLTRYDATASPPTVISLLDGCAGVPVGCRVDELSSLQRSLSFVGLDGNPDVHAEGWAAYRAVTADNLDITGWKLDLDEGYFSTRRGALVATHSLGLRLEDTASRIPVPTEIQHPEAIDLDHELASTLLDYLTKPPGSGSDEPQRVAVAIDWLTLAWRNTTSVASAARLIFLRTALEALFPGNAPQTARALREHFKRFADAVSIPVDSRLDELLWSPTEAPTHPARVKKRGELNTDLQDWFWSFNEARNDIIHDGQAESQVYDGSAAAYQGELFWTAERLVREVIRTKLAIAGYGDIWRRPDSRRTYRAAVAALEEYEARRTDQAASTPDGESE